MKRCSHCKQWKPATSEYFYRNKSNVDGLGRFCQVCQKESWQRCKIQGPREKSSTHKRCPTCKEWKPATTEFFVANKSEKSGLNTYCRQCWSIRYRKYPIVIDNVPDGYKRCTRCKEIKPATTDYFHRQAQAKSGLSPGCKECNHKATNDHYARNRTRIEKQHKIWQTANLEYFEACKKRWHLTHREERSESARQYRMLHPEKDSMYRRNRRARMKQAEGTHTAQDIQDQLERQKHRCYYCHDKFKKVGNKYIYHVDHLVPISRGGTNDKWNLVLACPHCNDSKGAKLPHEWFQGGRLM